jgi:GDP-4-dehydro-6-deoxy-D-mannose reductase
LLALAPSCQLIFASSAEIYGASFRSGSPLDETALLAPMNTYAASKAAADLALGAMVEQGLRVVRLRLFNHTGPGQAETFVAPAFARQIALIEAGRQPPVLHAGALNRLRDFVDVRDVCQAYVACLREAPRMAPGTIVNIASGAPRRIGDILDALLEMAGLRVKIVTDNALQRRSEIVSASGNAARAYQVLGWTPTVPWTQTLTDVLADWRKQTPNTGVSDAS